MDSEDVKSAIQYSISELKEDLKREFSITNYLKQIQKGNEAIQLLEDLLRHLEEHKRIKAEFKNKIYNFVNEE